MTPPQITGNIDFDAVALSSCLLGLLGPDGGTYSLERIGGGQSNPTYFLDWNTHRLVLRKKPNGALLKGAHAVEREYRVLTALRDTDVPVPTTLHEVQDPSVLGTPFYLMERVEGRVFHDPALPDAGRSDRRSVWFAAAETLARLHSVRPAQIGLSDYGRPGNYFARQMNLWTRQYQNSPLFPITPISQLQDWLHENVPPEDDRSSLCHGDFRLGNLIFHPTEPRVAAVLDWELSTLGHPMADLGFACMAWHTSPDEYGGLMGLDLVAAGLPSEGEFLARYQAQLGQPITLTTFHRAFALYRFAVIFVGIADRVTAGTAAASNAATLAPLAERFAERALALCGQAD